MNRIDVNNEGESDPFWSSDRRERLELLGQTDVFGTDATPPQRQLGEEGWITRVATPIELPDGRSALQVDAWSAAAAGKAPHWRLRDDGLLQAFVSLAESDDDAVLQFAERFGALDLCVHGLPFGHHMSELYNLRVSDPTSDEHDFADLQRLPLPGAKLRCLRELVVQPTQIYRDLACEVRAIVRSADAITAGETGETADWQWLQFGPRGSIRGPITVARLRRLVEDRVRLWLFRGHVRVGFWWSKDYGVRLSLTGRGLWGAIARQLVHRVARAPFFATCSACGETYVPTRRPRKGQQTWCRNRECQRERRRRAMKKHRAKHRSARARRLS